MTITKQFVGHNDKPRSTAIAISGQPITACKRLVSTASPNLGLSSTFASNELNTGTLSLKNSRYHLTDAQEMRRINKLKILIVCTARSRSAIEVREVIG